MGFYHCLILLTCAWMPHWQETQQPWGEPNTEYVPGKLVLPPAGQFQSWSYKLSASQSQDQPHNIFHQ